LEYQAPKSRNTALLNSEKSFEGAMAPCEAQLELIFPRFPGRTVAEFLARVLPNENTATFFSFASSRLRVRSCSFWISPISQISGEVFLLFLLLSLPAYAQGDVSGGRIDSGTYQRVVDENLELRKEQARLEVEAGELRRKNAALLLDVQDLERKRDQLTVLISQLKTPEETRSEMARLQSEKLVLVREIERLRQALMATAAPPSSNVPPPVAAPAPATGSDLFLKIEKENADLRLELARVRESALNESVGRTVATTNEAILKVAVGDLTAQVKQARTELAALQKREAGLKKALDTQARKTFEAEKKVSGQEAGVGDLKSQISDLKSQNAALKSQISNLKSEISNLKPASAPPNNSATQQLNNSVPALLLAAEKELAARRLKEAEALYLKALKLEPRNPRVSYNLGVLYGDYLKDPGQAAKYYRRYLELAPRAPDAGNVRSWILELDARSKW
jgi:tetratricopeptide (TPR) repeat protein